MSLSVIIIAKNESHDIVKCIESVSFADEIIVIDGGSSDDTVAKAQACGAIVHVNSHWQGFGFQKNLALHHATQEWVLSIDADERVSPELKEEIQQVIARQSFTVFRIPRSSSYCGHFMRHGGWWPDYVVRLFKRGDATFSLDRVHERLESDKPLGTLRHPLIHYTYDTLEEVIAKTNHYSTLGADMLFDKGRKASLTIATLKGLWAFIRTYFLRAGFLDGGFGFLLAVSNAQTTFYRYAKLWLKR
ncbi:MAG: LPS biosynthesis protein [Ferrovum sp. 37-45-19]|jgi:glycosyltransferase involved in cell wall biosynthesis|uniref:glycosyltransferase family 2 protein n=1 Tax=Ferrovum sp. JA12 TaxID=1356299 RepID=UPI00070300E6|nr:glycosyltransferase family 2 protein [Ferrovum sp. JA12]OYV79350.1 MAG: LPS biosynthesis protein [Ferrovum sp. 21-44-67]OYV94011.1 MAG: LPS biosynthesis protein [Ferrovum sp. 37-45-19]OZB34454.1 MAG: LPS biosynthesis protein [Ferrovum sp. 34-44-207]HQT81846.1 glycosyltransferase family 2 protein [Ferrovaceae bacterium]KRH79353.1 SPBc2 prophage-derived glycosyltransferase SunS [Ferrovum sp. JA12]